MTRQEALHRIEVLLNQNRANLAEAERLALEHDLSFSAPDADTSSTYYPTVESFKADFGWDDEEAEENLADVGLELPGWVSSGAFC